jgi:hypothetical protein
VRKAAGTSPPASPTEEEFTLLAIIGPADHRANKNTSCLRLLHDVDEEVVVFWFWLLCDFFSQSVLISQDAVFDEHNLHTILNPEDAAVNESPRKNHSYQARSKPYTSRINHISFPTPPYQCQDDTHP